MKEPSIITEHRDGISHMSIADKLMQNNELWLDSPINAESVGRIMAALHVIEERCANDKDGIIDDCVRLVISGPGGKVTEALVLAHYLLHTPLRITTTAIGNCCSASALVFLAGEQREMFQHTKLMFHEVQHTPPEDAKYSIQKIEQIWNDMKNFNNDIYELIAEVIGKNKGEVAEMLSGKELWLTEKEALEQGFATEIIDTL